MKIQFLVGMVALVMGLVLSNAGEAADLTGGWKGILSSADGSQAEVEIDFSPQGFPLYSYTNNKGLTRQVELSHVGQTVEYVPSGGGVQRMVVERVEKGPGRLTVGITGSFERASQGYLDQQQEAALFEYTLVPGGLKMRVTTSSTSHFGDKDLMVGGDPNAVVAEGVLKKMR